MGLVLSTVTRYALRLSYDGAAYQGWQKQPQGQTIQSCLEAALSRMAGHPVHTICAGRTDAGVHALNQVVHFDTVAHRPLSAWIKGVNAALPDTIAVHHCASVDQHFHARFSAQQRHYVYVLLCQPIRPCLFRHQVGWIYDTLDVAEMEEAAAYLIGEHDFSAFRSAHCQAPNPVRCLSRLAIRQTHTMILFYFTANAFLHHMIRNIVGALIWVGRGMRPPHWLSFLLQMRSRTLSAPTFMPDGLYLTHVDYPASYDLGVCQESADFGFPFLPGLL